MAYRKKIPAATQLRLFASSSGHCQNPDCLCLLFPRQLGGDKHIAEMAHVIPHGQNGPRNSDRPEKRFDVDAFENLILLCPSCHTLIDKAPDAYPRNLLLSWKVGHIAKLAQKEGIRGYETRGEVRYAVEACLNENKVIWERFAPVDGSEFEFDPESEISLLWQQRVKSVVLPNHYRIESIIEANMDHATDEERQIFAEYKEHVRGLAERHICEVAGRAIRFPAKMENIFL